MAAKNKKKGTYIRLADQDELIELTHNVDPTSWVVCHMFRPRNKRCRQLENHLRILAEKYPDTTFCAVNATKASFLMLLLGVLPEMVILQGMRVRDTIFGYTELLDGDDFSMEMIEKRIALNGAIVECKADLKPPADVKPKKNKRRPKKKGDGDNKKDSKLQN
ncbi:thioredoxin domain-containing protein 9-like isoform X1 [Drosophila obscura]|uniref:thioredoxin domain-containing protein 9-like isoform X1 n=1 Tax=Drosophila obscura TaxID=7282 RepID=UPI001BB162AC|nr:thioredoxin domain-containing protein 9-like isoform X1 [Drosophila obscura]